MKTTAKWLSIAGAIIVLSPALMCVANIVHARIILHRFAHADHTRVLAACREAILHRDSYRNDHVQWGPLYADKVVILPPLPGNVPLAIRSLKPRDIVIFEDDIFLNFSIPFYRIGIIGYKSGAKQSGTLKYIDGLWLLSDAR